MLLSTCEAVLWGAKGEYKFTNWLCGNLASIKLGSSWYCEDHIETGIAATGEVPVFIRKRAND